MALKASGGDSHSSDEKTSAFAPTNHGDLESGLGFSPSPVVAELSRIFADVPEVPFVPPRIFSEISSLFKFPGHSLCLYCAGGHFSFALPPSLVLLLLFG